MNFYENKFTNDPTNKGYEFLSSINTSPKKLISSVMEFVQKEKEYEVIFPEQINILKINNLSN